MNHLNHKVYEIYEYLLGKYGPPREIWPQWYGMGKSERVRVVVAMGAFLTQRTSWKNAESALKNLQAADLLSLENVAQVDLPRLTELVRVAGFFNTKPRRLQEFCRFVVKCYGTLSKMANEQEDNLRAELLSLHGVGPETADTLLLYALDKPSFVIDEYTKKFVAKYGLTQARSYEELKRLFEDSLPKDVEVYQNYHVLIIVDRKGKDLSIMEEV